MKYIPALTILPMLDVESSPQYKEAVEKGDQYKTLLIRSELRAEQQERVLRDFSEAMTVIAGNKELWNKFVEWNNK